MTAPDDLARTLADEVDGIALIIASTSGSAGAPALTAAEAIVAHLASVVSRRDADLRTRPTTLQAVEDFAESLAQEAERYTDDDETGDVTAEWVRDRFADWRSQHALSATDSGTAYDRAARYDRLVEFAKWERQD